MAQPQVVTFKPIPATLANKLLTFAQRKNIGKQTEIDGSVYTLDHMSIGTSAYFRSRSCSIYYRVNRSVIRISDHWSHTPDHPRSRKLNCGEIRGRWQHHYDDDGYHTETRWKPGVIWQLPAGAERIQWTSYTGKYPWELYAGSAGLTVLNKSTDHWKQGA